MSINANYLSIKNPPVEQLDPYTLFGKFCHQGLVTVNFAESKMQVAEQNRAVRELHIPNRKELFPNERWLLESLVDPAGKLADLFLEGKIAGFRGNCSLAEAQIILVDDAHTNNEMTLIRGRIANALKRQQNSLLCESYSSSTWRFSPSQINERFAPNLDPELKNSFMAGWDDDSAYKQSMERVRMYLALSRDASNTENTETMKQLMKEIDALTLLRTKSEYQSIMQFYKPSPNTIMFVFAGAEHNNDEWLIQQLAEQGIKFAILTPVGIEETLEKTTTSSLEEYYRVPKQVNPWKL